MIERRTLKVGESSTIKYKHQIYLVKKQSKGYNNYTNFQICGLLIELCYKLTTTYNILLKLESTLKFLIVNNIQNFILFTEHQFSENLNEPSSKNKNDKYVICSSLHWYIYSQVASNYIIYICVCTCILVWLLIGLFTLIFVLVSDQKINRSNIDSFAKSNAVKLSILEMIRILLIIKQYYFELCYELTSHYWSYNNITQS